MPSTIKFWRYSTKEDILNIVTGSPSISFKTAGEYSGVMIIVYFALILSLCVLSLFEFTVDNFELVALASAANFSEISVNRHSISVFPAPPIQFALTFLNKLNASVSFFSNSSQPIAFSRSGFLEYFFKSVGRFDNYCFKWL